MKRKLFALGLEIRHHAEWAFFILTPSAIYTWLYWFLHYFDLKPFPFSPFHHLLFATLNFHHLTIFVCFSWQFEIAGLNWTCNIFSYNMASSVSGQDESNPALWLANWVGNMDLSCLFGTTCRAPQEKLPWKPYNKSFIDQACSVKMAGH